MKIFLGIIVLGLMLSGCVLSSKPNDLIGKKILCGEWSSDNEVLITKLPIDGYDFISQYIVVYYKMSKRSRNGFTRVFLKYKINNDEIIIEMTNGIKLNLNRSTGIRRANYSNIKDVICKPLSDDKNIRKILNKIHKLQLEKLKF